MRNRLSWSSAVIAGVVLASASAANAAEVTLGSTAIPAGSSGGPCPPTYVVAQATSDPATPYTVPDLGTITEWRTNAADASPGAAITLVVLEPGTDGFTVVGVDSRTLPSPLPPDNVASFTTAIPVTGGDMLGLYTGASDEPFCHWSGGSTPLAASLIAIAAPSAPATGQTLTPVGPSGPGFTMNLAATVDIDLRQDAGVTATAGPANATVGDMALLGSSVTNGGPQTDPLTFTDTVPAGLTIVSAVAGSGTCSIGGQQVTCTISDLAPGQSAPVNIAVTPTAAGSYTNTASVAAPPPNVDPNAANNSATATLAVAAPLGPPAVTPPVTPPAPPRCVVPKLKRTPAAVARRLLGLLGCKAGKTKRVRSKSVAKGAVIKTTPKAGSYTALRKVRIIVSSGPKKKKPRGS